MENLELKNVFYCQDNIIPEYLRIYIETNTGFLKYNFSSLDFIELKEISSMRRYEEIDRLRNYYGTLFINEARVTYDNNIYLLVANKFILAIEYTLNSTSSRSYRQIAIIEDLQGKNSIELNNFYELEILNIN